MTTEQNIRYRNILIEPINSLPQYVYDIAEKISNADNKSAGLMANYVLKYFEDMQKHLSSVYAGLAAKGRVFYIIGNSNFYNITVPAEKLRKTNCQKMLMAKVLWTCIPIYS